MSVLVDARPGNTALGGGVLVLGDESGPAPRLESDKLGPESNFYGDVGTLRASPARVKKQRSPELAVRTVVVSTAAAARMHIRLGNPRLAGESVTRGMAMLEDVRAKFAADTGEPLDGVYRDGRRRLQELAEEAEAHCSSARN